MKKNGPVTNDERDQILVALRDPDHVLTRIRETFGRRIETIRKIAAEFGIEVSQPVAVMPQIPLPDDFADHAATSSNPQLMQRYGVSINVITRFRKQSGIAAPKAGTTFAPLAMPDGFALVAPTMTIKQLRLHYGRGPEVIHRWLGEANVRPKKLAFGYQNGAKTVVHRDMSRIGQIADFLRYWGPVCRCNPNGRADPKGTHWRRGSAVLTDAELTVRAIAKGFDADDWKRIAA